MPRLTLTALVLLGAGGLGACQGYDFIFQPDADRTGTHLRFAVEQPSKADILFVVDNSISMTEEQVALTEAIGVLLSGLAPQDTRYRIAVTSTDALGFSSNCAGAEEEFVRPDFPGARGDCARSDIVIRRPHDGAVGRLMAAYVPEIFDVTSPGNPLFPTAVPPEEQFPEELKPILARVLPTSATTHPSEFDAFTGFKGEPGARWVIDRETIKLEACQACEECTIGSGMAMVCNEEDACYEACAQPVAIKIVEAYFRANVAALGIGGQGYEQGLKSATLAVGIDIEDPNDETALGPTRGWTRLPDGANTFLARDDAGVPGQSSWLRDEALLAVMVVSDEEDCSMPAFVWDKHCAFEQGCDRDGEPWSPPLGWVAQPVGSLCYQDEVRAQLLSTTRTSQLIVRKKGDSVSRVAVGFIGGVEQQGGDHRLGRAADCAVSGTGAPTTQCSCLASQWVFPDNLDDCNAWCQYTVDDGGECIEPTSDFYCDAMAGSRYVAFADTFRRRTYESVCKAEGDLGFGDAMAKFAQIATLACFELVGVSPAGVPPNAELIVVKRASRDDAEDGIPPTLLPRQEPDSDEVGWYFDFEDNVPRICLTGIDRLVGDVYDIFLLTKDDVDFTR